MENYNNIPEMPGYVSVKQAAEMLDVSDTRIYFFIEQKRLHAVWAANAFIIPLEEVQNFKRSNVGRPRKNTPAWRISTDENTQYMTLIFVQLRPGQLDAFVQKLEEMRKRGLHSFPGTVARYIVGDNQKSERVIITFVWRGTVMPDEATREEHLPAFREALCDVLDWEAAEYHQGRAFMHT